MGLYDIFVANALCPNCRHKYRADFQSKDFDCLFDSIEQGEDVRKPVDSWILYRGTLFDPRFTVRKAKAIVARNPRKYELKVDDTGTRQWVALYKNSGKRKRGFADVREARFELYDTCPRCKAFLDGTGVIKNYVFKGAVGLRTSNGTGGRKRGTGRLRRRVKLIVRESRD